MAMTSGRRAWLVVFLKGAFMGAADTVPGVSGGTIALIVGIYERLIAALTSLDPRALGGVRRLHTREGRATFAATLLAMDVPFLFVLGAGILAAAATIASLMNLAVTQYPAPTYAFFFGLIAASAIVLYRHVDIGTPRRLAVSIGGFVFAVVVTGVTAGGTVSHTPAVVFLAGAIAISAMVLPGVSGAFLLLVLGQYEFVSGLPRALGEGLLGGDPTALQSVLIPFGAFMAGAVVGLFSVAYAVRAALDRYRAATLAFLVSLMVGALRLPLERVLANVGGVSPRTATIVAAPSIAGALVVFVLDRYTAELEY